MSKNIIAETTSKRSPRKTTIWTREKIAQLIELYRRSDCLWNHFNEAYKNKESRGRAIEHICKTLNINKFDFGKKIHNLRNQFNSEMKKLERRIEEYGGNVSEVEANSTTTPITNKRCRWEHFESLMFLRSVIEPRPGGYQSIAYTPQIKKLRAKSEYEENEHNSSDVLHPGTFGVNCAYEDSNTTHNTNNQPSTNNNSQFNNNTNEEYRNCANDVLPTAATNSDNTCTEAHFTRRNNMTSNNTPESSSNMALNVFATPPPTVNTKPDVQMSNAFQMEFNSTTNSTNVSQVSNEAITSASASINVSHTARDQWDAFGELIANEFRNLNSEISRKRLKRRIMQAMLEIGDEDDVCNQ